MTDNFITSSLLKNKFYCIGYTGQEDTHMVEPLSNLQKDILRDRNGEKLSSKDIRNLKYRVVWPIFTMHEFTGKCVENLLQNTAKMSSGDWLKMNTLLFLHYRKKHH